MIRSLHQLPDSASVTVCRIAGLGQDVSLLCEQCGSVLLCVCGSDVSITEAFYNASDEAYHLFFGCKLGDQDKKWAPHIVCKSCARSIGGRINRKGMAMPFAVPMVWMEPLNHSSDCYFCLTPVAIGMNRKKKEIIDYPNIPSAIRSCASWGICAHTRATKRILFEFRDGRGRQRKQDLPKKNLQIQTTRASIWVTSQT